MLINTGRHSRATINRRAQGPKPGEPGSYNGQTSISGGFSSLCRLSPELKLWVVAGAALLCPRLQARAGSREKHTDTLLGSTRRKCCRL